MLYGYPIRVAILIPMVTTVLIASILLFAFISGISNGIQK